MTTSKRGTAAVAYTRLRQADVRCDLDRTNAEEKRRSLVARGDDEEGPDAARGCDDKRTVQEGDAWMQRSGRL